MDSVVAVARFVAKMVRKSELVAVFVVAAAVAVAVVVVAVVS